MKRDRMSECEAVRQFLEEGAQEVRVAAHLEHCAPCRAEAAFQQRVARAVAAMPRVPAPEGLVARVMAEVSPRPEVALPARPAPPLALRPWELGWLGAACLLVAALLSPVLPGHPLASVGAPGDLRLHWSGAGDWQFITLSGVWQSLSGTWSQAGEWGRSWISLSAPWLAGAAAFALAFSLLLSWRSGGGRSHEEEAYA